MRVGEACHLLASTDLRVVDVCEDSGFRNLSNFNKIFKAQMKMTPRQYRQLSQQKMD